MKVELRAKFVGLWSMAEMINFEFQRNKVADLWFMGEMINL